MIIACIRAPLRAVCLACLAALGPAPAPAGAGEPEASLRAGPLAPGPPVLDERVLSRERLARFYARRGHRPIWIESGALNAHGWAALSVLASAFDEGLDPAKYFFGPIQARVAAHDRYDAAPDQEELDSLISAGLG